ncbi:hypothetical protein Undi14_14730 [Undibacterium sp. 14-3-2]|jgi:hypothetical protein|uniref:hypothetical protein n=1 Tax=Undibacterium sp. 14-3-2 TaxID=2800129 RepID=UPI0019037AFF|nr:hypothetical protein [Undibacterium sp. 14-3-2]MBK1891291.1 hypothetical protein [Undibacterium sp. 14-3-2]
MKISTMEKSMPIELRKWFQLTIGILSLSMSGICWFVIRSYIPPSAGGAQMALSILLMGASSGLFLILGKLMPLLIVKFFPGIEN